MGWRWGLLASCRFGTAEFELELGTLVTYFQDPTRDHNEEEAGGWEFLPRRFFRTESSSA